MDLVLESKVRLLGLVAGALTLINICLFRHLIYNSLINSLCVYMSVSV